MIYGWFLGVGAVAAIVIWGLVWMRIGRAMRGVPTLRVGQALATANLPAGRVCVIVPAHNESRVIAGLVRSLRAETYPDMRVVLALDRCTDDTASLARAQIGDDPRFEIVEIDICPPDWVGKVHALHAGTTLSRGAAGAEYLLFADEGHGFARPENQRKFVAAVEPFLARHLGGRVEPPDEAERWEEVFR